MYIGSSAAFDAAIKQSGQIVCSKLRITLKNGDVYNLTDNDFIGASLEIEKSAFPNNVFELGGTVAKTISFSLNNHDKKWDNISFKDAKVEAWSGLVISGTPEYVPLGTFWIDSAGKPLDVVDITGCDSILKLEKSYSSSTLAYPATIKQILEEIASKCGVSLTTSNIFNSDVTVNFTPDKTKYTFRDILSFVATIAGGFARISRENQLEIVQLIQPETGYSITPSLRASSKTDYTISITGLAYYGSLQNILYGSDTYPLILDNNPLIDGMLASTQTTVLESLYNLYNGFTYTPFECEFVGDPRIDEGDYVILKDTRDGDIGTYIFKYVFTNGGTQSIEAPICDELDKNFLDSNKKKASDTESKIEYAYNNGGGAATITTYTHDEYSDLNKPISTYLNETGSILKTYFSVEPTMDGSYLGADGSYWVLIGYTRSIHVDPYSGNIGVEIKNIPADYDSNKRLLFDSAALNDGEDIKQFVDFKLYTSEEYQQLLKMFNNNFNSIERWPILHVITPNRMDNSSRQGTIVPMEVSSSAIVSVDPYHDVREYQLAQALYNMFNLLNIYGFSDFFKSVKDVYHYLLAYRVEVDQGGYVPDSGGSDDSGDNSGGDNTGGSTDTGGGDSGESGGTEGGEDTGETTDPIVPTGFTNPLPSLTGSSANIQPASTNANLQALYSYDADTNIISLDYNYMNYNDWLTQSASYQIDLSLIESDSADSFTYTTTTTEDSKVTAAITAITFTFDTTNNKILIKNTFNETDEADLNEVLNVEIELT